MVYRGPDCVLVAFHHRSDGAVVTNTGCEVRMRIVRPIHTPRFVTT